MAYDLETAQAMHDHEMDVETSPDRAWCDWATEVEQILGIDNLAFCNEDTDHCSLDFAYEAWCQNMTAATYAAGVKARKAVQS
jgi:hypothetical protein